MLKCAVELLLPGYTVEGKPGYMTIAEYSFDPGFFVNDEVRLQFSFGGHSYYLESTVTKRQNEVHQAIPSSKQSDLFLLRIFVEGADRDTVLKISEDIQKSEFMV
jgi:hypothetical protein